MNRTTATQRHNIRQDRIYAKCLAAKKAQAHEKPPVEKEDRAEICTHTPGPWRMISDAKLNPKDPMFYRVDIAGGGGGKRVAIASGVGIQEAIANARLIAAAPTLLQAAKEAIKLIDLARRYFPKSIKNSDKFTLESTCAAIGTAIAKAEGR
jgi:hypothetical protein